MSSAGYRKFSEIVVLVFILLLIIQVSGKAIDVDADEDDELFQTFNKSPKRKSARMAFLEDSDDPMFKFLTKLLNTAQIRTKNNLSRAKNGIKEAQELKTEVTKRLKTNHLPLEQNQ